MNLDSAPGLASETPFVPSSREAAYRGIVPGSRGAAYRVARTSDARPRTAAAAMLALLLLAPGFAAAQGTAIYKWVDDKGVVHYSNEAVKGAEKLQVDTAPAGVVMPKAKAPAKPAADGGAGYAGLSIASPKSGEEFRDNDGSLSVTLAVDPALQSGAGHAIVVSVDGKALPQRYLSPSLTLTGLDRGIHTLQASVVDADGKVLITSGTLSFTLHQASALAPTGPRPRPR